MALTQPRTLKFDSVEQPTLRRLLSLLQDSIVAAIAPVLAVAFLDGRLVTSVAIVGGTPTIVNHGLGRAPIGWFVVAPNANATVWQSASATPDKTLILNASATVTTGIWVF